MLQFAKRINAKEDILSHYKKEILRYKELISFKDYILMVNTINKLDYIKSKIKFLWYILRIGIE